MIYQNERAIYVKIADRVCDDILSGKYQEDERVPSVRELAAEYEVNTNTVLRTFDILHRPQTGVPQARTPRIPPPPPPARHDHRRRGEGVERDRMTNPRCVVCIPLQRHILFVSFPQNRDNGNLFINFCNLREKHSFSFPCHREGRRELQRHWSDDQIVHFFITK